MLVIVVNDDISAETPLIRYDISNNINANTCIVDDDDDGDDDDDRIDWLNDRLISKHG